MIVAERQRSAGRPALGHDKKLHDLFEIILGEHNGLQSGDQVFHGKLIDLERRNYMEQFKGWCMPEERPGYIKPRKHDFL